MKQNILYILFLLLILTGCAGKGDSEESNIETSRYYIEAGQPIASVIDTLKLYELDFLKDLIGYKISQKAMQESVYLEVTATADSHQVHEIVLDAFNVDFKIFPDSSDSVKYRVHVEKPILKGGSIYQVLTDLGMKAKHVGFYAWRMGEYIDATSIDVGDIFTVDYTLDSLNVKTFEKFSYIPDKTSIHEFPILGERELGYQLVELPYELRRRFLTGEITETNWTLDAAMGELGIIPYIRQQANNALASQIAFSTDARVGDSFEVYIEEKYVDGELQPRGKMLYVEYSGKYTRTKSAYRFNDEKDASAFTGMYTTSGKRLVTDAVRTPLDRMHITSAFGYRIHPITGKRTKHQGIDYRGSRGTNIYAVTDGTVIKAKDGGGGYGKEVKIRHANGMITQYAHMSRINTRYGRHVKKGQIIGKVGTTGNSTGPHLHFGVMKNGRWVNPKTNLKMVGANQLKDKRLKLFKQQLNEYNAEMDIQRQAMMVPADSLGAVENGR